MSGPERYPEIWRRKPALRPVRLFAEAARAPEPDGRLMVCEPAITPLGGLVYRFFHHEPVEKLPALVLNMIERFSFVAYLLSGGFRSWSLLPSFAANSMLRLEWALRRVFGRLAALRLIAVYAKRAAPPRAAEARA